MSGQIQYRRLWWVLGCLLAGSAVAAQDEAGDVNGRTEEEPLSVEEILSEPSESYVDTPRCIRSGRIRRTDVIDSQHIAFKVGRDKYYLVQLRFPCPTLRRDSTIMIESSGQGLCAMDRVQAVNDSGRHPGPPCQIPGFQQITMEQLALLKEQLKLKRSGDLIDEIDPDVVRDGAAADSARNDGEPPSGR